MKKIIQPGVEEKFVWVCDICRKEPEWGIGATVQFHFGYGSQRDMDQGEAHFCNGCAENFFQEFQAKYPWFKLKTIEL